MNLLDCARIATKLTHHTQREDLMQDCIVKIIEKKREEYPSWYIIKAMKNSLINWHKTEVIRNIPIEHSVTSCLEGELNPYVYKMPNELLDYDEYRKFDAFGHLSPRDRCLLEWSNIYGESQVSGCLGMNYRTVKRRVKKLRRKRC